MGKIVGIKEYAAHVGVHRSVVQRKIAAGLLPAHKVAGVWLIDYDEEWVDRRQKRYSRKREANVSREQAEKKLHQSEEIDSSFLDDGGA